MLGVIEVGTYSPWMSRSCVLTLEDPERFPNSRVVGPYLGLCPRRRDSGAHSPQLRITKSGVEIVHKNAAPGYLEPQHAPGA